MDTVSSFIIEVAGIICAGKMTLINKLREIMDERYETKLRIIAEDLTAHLILDPTDYYSRQTRLAGQVTTELIDARSNGGVTVVHRGLFDCKAFMGAYVKAGYVLQDMAECQVRAWEGNAAEYTDGVVLVKTSPEEAFERLRVKHGGLPNNGVFGKDFFGQLCWSYERLEAELREALGSSLIVVCGEGELEEAAKRNAAKVLKGFGSYLQGGPRYDDAQAD